MIKKVIKHIRLGSLSKVSIRWFYDCINNIIPNLRTINWYLKKMFNDESFVFSLENNLKINLYFDSILCKTIYVMPFERNELGFVDKYLKENDIFVDVGANIGLFSIIAGKKVGINGKVFGFEPVEKSSIRYNSNMKLNQINNAKCYQIALSDSEGINEMNISKDGFDAWNSFVTPSMGNKFIRKEVTVSTIDQIFKNEHFPIGITLMKIDVEGWESKVISGGSKLFKSENAPVLLVEFTDKNANSAGFSCEELYKQICSFGYSIYEYRFSNNRLIPALPLKYYEYTNLICCKNIEEVEKRLVNREN